MTETPHSSKIEVKLTSRDVVRFNFSILYKRGILGFMILIGLMMAIMILVKIAQGDPFREYQIPAFVLLFTVLLPVMTYIGARRSYDNKFMKETKTYAFSPEGFRMESESTTSDARWEDIRRVVVTKKAVYLFIAANAAHILPRRCMPGDEALQMIERYIPKQIRQKGKYQALGRILILLLIFLVTVGVVQFLLAQG